MQLQRQWIVQCLLSAWFLFLFSGVGASVSLAQSAAEIPKELRTWRDKTGSYNVEAKLLEITKESVKLLKSDGRVVTVPRGVLSAEDQKHLAELEKKPANPFSGGVQLEPEMPSSSGRTKSAGRRESQGLELLNASFEPSELSSNGQSIFIGADEEVQPVGPAGNEIRPKWFPFAKGMTKYDAYTRRSPPILIDAEHPTFLMSAHRVGNASSDETFGRVYRFQHGRKTEELVLDLPHTLRVFDHHIESDSTLAAVHIEAGTERGGDLVLMRGLAAGDAGVVQRWHLPEWDKPGFKPKVEYAKLTSESTAVVQVNDSAYVWDLSTGECSFKVEKIQSGAKIRLSANGRYLALPATRKCQLLDLNTGELMATFPFPKLTPEVNFSPDGTKLALVAGTQADVWNLQSGEKLHEIVLSGNSGGFQGWVGNQYLLLKHVGLVDLDLGMAVWSYYLPSQVPAVVLNEGVMTVDLHSKSAIFSLPVPHDRVAAATRSLTSGQSRLLALRPGSEVAIRVTSNERVDLDAMRAGMRKAVENAGWKVNDRSSTVVSAEIGRGKKQTLHFRYLLSSMFDPGEKVKIQPFTASIEIRKGSRVIWSRSSANMVPSLIHLEQGESLKRAVKKYEKADPEYFERLMIPSKILTPEAAKHVGRSRIDSGKWVDF